jgi:type II secretory pathway pseudopilin PulG
MQRRWSRLIRNSAPRSSINPPFLNSIESFTSTPGVKVMNSAKCTNCGFVGWADAEFCKKCGSPMGAAVVDGWEPPAGNFTPSYSNDGFASEAELKKGLAVTSLVLGILNFLLLGILVVPTVVGIVVSVVALNKIKRFPHVYGGKSLAIGGLVTNIVTAVCLVPVLIIAAIAIPNLLAARRAANEGATLRALRTLHSAEATYQATKGRGNYGSLTDLQGVSLIPTDLAGGVKSGYRYKVQVVDATSGRPASFEAVAVPTEYGGAAATGTRSFFIDETGVLRGEDTHGLEANRNTPPINSNRDYGNRRLETRRSTNYSDDD